MLHVSRGLLGDARWCLPVVALTLLGACVEEHRVRAVHDSGAQPDASDNAQDAGEDSGEDAGEDAATDAATDANTSPTDADAGDAAAEGAASDAGQDAGPIGFVFPDDVDPPCPEQIEGSLDGLPDDIACLGLYQSVRDKTIAPAVRRFAPAVPLWSDGSGKQRWVYLPPGETIDASDNDNWVFPIGTKFFKEFRVDGRRVETRVFHKVRDNRWVRATYEWDRDELTATRSFGRDLEDVQIAGTQYHVPTPRECDQCHGGRRDRVLGFEAVSLGLAGAEGITLRDLIVEGLLSPPPRQSVHTIGDDGTGVGGEVLTWLHINCGVSCHNANQNAEAYSSGLFMKLRANELDGRPVNGMEPVLNLVGQPAKTLRWGERTRLVAGSPEQSLIYQLVTSRAGPREQMPPIATKVVPTEVTDRIEEWIRALD